MLSSWLKSTLESQISKLSMGTSKSNLGENEGGEQKVEYGNAQGNWG